jgi:hypothetical protein
MFLMWFTEYKLESYFAKHYTKLYIEFDGQYKDWSGTNLFKTPMQNYFSSGKYKELNDPDLEVLWKKTKREKNIGRVISGFFTLALIILIAIATDKPKSLSEQSTSESSSSQSQQTTNKRSFRDEAIFRKIETDFTKHSIPNLLAIERPSENIFVDKKIENPEINKHKRNPTFEFYHTSDKKVPLNLTED